MPFVDILMTLAFSAKATHKTATIITDQPDYRQLTSVILKLLAYTIKPTYYENIFTTLQAIKHYAGSDFYRNNICRK
jgi:hypothetical protein